MNALTFFEMVNCHIIAAGMYFFGLKELSSEPKANVIALAVRIPISKGGGSYSLMLLGT